MLKSCMTDAVAALHCACNGLQRERQPIGVATNSTRIMLEPELSHLQYALSRILRHKMKETGRVDEDRVRDH